MEVIVELDEGQEILDFLFANTDCTCGSQPNRQLSLTQPAKGSYRIASNSSLDTPVLTKSRNEAMRLLMDKAVYCLAEACDGGLLLHAAVVARKGQAVVMPAASGAGKSTLSGWLSKQGFQYCTDELVFLPTGGTQLECLTRPMIIKNAARDMMSELLGLDGLEQDCYLGPIAMMVPFQQTNTDNGRMRPQIALLVFPCYQQDADFQHIRLTPAQTGMRLMSVLVNARNLPDHGFAETARMAQIVQACELRYASFAQIEGHFPTIFETAWMDDGAAPHAVSRGQL